MTNNDAPAVTEKNNENWFTIVSVSFALLIMIGYSFFLYFMVGKAGNKLDEVTWTRLIYLFSGVEAIVFSAVGFIFGREVNRGRAEKAEKDKEKSEKEKDDAKRKERIAKELAKEAQLKGENLARFILTKVETSGDDDSNILRVRSMSKDNPENEILDIVNFTKKIYPDVD